MAEYGILRAGTLVSAGAATLPLSADSYLVETVILQVEPGAATVSIGTATACTFALVSGAAPLVLNVDRLDKVYVAFPAAGGRVNWLAGSK